MFPRRHRSYLPLCRSAVPVVLATVVLVSPRAAVSQGRTPGEAIAEVPLFSTHEPLALTIRAPLERILQDRRQDSEESPGVVFLAAESGDTVTVPVEIRTRGSTRLQERICEFPPLRLDFREDDVRGTVFEGQEELKLVTHCRTDRVDYEQHVLTEYLVYRAYGLLTDAAFRVRLATITYDDVERDDLPFTRTAILIEDDDQLASRLGWAPLELPALPLPTADTAQMALVELFQYFIGNTDYSTLVPEPGDAECCHNVQLIGSPNGPVVPVPYDFDLSGVVHAEYADRLYRENLRRLGIGSVRDRLYRGWCGSRPYVAGALARFRERRTDLSALVRSQSGLRPAVTERIVAYIDAFYAVIGDEEAVTREIHDRCRGLG